MRVIFPKDLGSLLLCVSPSPRPWAANGYYPACLQKFNRISDLRSPCVLNPITTAGTGALRGEKKAHVENAKLIPMKYQVKHHPGQSCVRCKSS